MKLIQICLVAGVALASCGIASAQFAAGARDPSLNASTPKVIPVLVNVDRAGKVTSVSSSTRLEPRYDRLLRSNLDEMITKPAMDHGKPMSSQFVMNVALEVTPRPQGDYDARFVYVSANPVPPGSWYWNHIDGHRLALENRNQNWRQRGFDQRQPRDWQPSYRQNFQPAPTPPAPSAPTTAQSGNSGKAS